MAFPSLQSGVQYDSKFPTIQKGAESIYGAMGQIVGQKLQDEQAKRKMYDELLNIGLDEVKGKYQDEAVKLKSDLLKRTAQMFADSEGLPSSEQMKEINAGRGKLTNYAKMYSGMEDWYKQASLTAAQITDKKYREKTIANIADIMDKPSLSETWDAILSKPWLEMPPEMIDIYKARKAILDNADYDNSPFQAKGMDRYGKIIYEGWKYRNPEQIRTGSEAYWNQHEDELKEIGFKDVDQFTEEFIGNEKVPENRIMSQSKGSGASEKKKTKVYFNEGTQAWEFSDLNKGKGIPIADFTPEDAKASITDATITRIFVDPNTGQLNAKVVAPSMTSMSFDDVKAKYGDKLANQMILLKPEIMAGKSSKDPLNLTDFYVPYYMVSSFTDRYIDLQPRGSQNSNNDPDGLFGGTTTTPTATPTQTSTTATQNTGVVGQKIDKNKLTKYPSPTNIDERVAKANGFLEIDPSKYDKTNKEQIIKMLGGVDIVFNMTNNRTNDKEEMEMFKIAQELENQKDNTPVEKIQKLQQFIISRLK